MYGTRPLSKLESAVYVIVVSVLALVFVDRMYGYFSAAERAAVEATLLNTQSALHTRFAYDLMRGNAQDPVAWTAHNPFELAQMTLGNFAGERDAPDPGALEGGKWVYDRATHQIIYLPRFSRGLSVDGGGGLLRFRLVVGASDRVPRLVPVVPYRWEP